MMGDVAFDRLEDVLGDWARLAPERGPVAETVVALADAWRSGAHAWTAEDRARFANDPQNLLAVDGAANQDKGAASADEWLPPQRGYRCRYVAAQVTVKARWSLSVTTAERRAIGRALDSCVTVETPSTGRASPGWAPSSPRSR